MSNSIITVQDAGGANQAIAKVPDTGRAAAQFSLPMTLCNEDQANLATQATLLTVANSVANLATQATVANLATQATVANLATQATVANLATQATLLTVANSVAAINANTPIVHAQALGNMVPVTSLGFVANNTFNRPNNTTTYNAGAVVGSSTAANGAVLTFNTAGIAGDLVLTGNDIRIDAAAVPTGATSFRLHLYNAAPASQFGDAGAWSLTANDRTAYLGYVDMGIPALAGATTVWGQTDGSPKQVRTLGAIIYAYLVTNGAMVPTANLPFTLNLRGIGV